ncbi:MAG: GHKL domain-containing protein [Clostridiaceae bacterium]|nr:GHKL domain-containing protein [Clostridiaceae bacterium]
MFGQYQSLVGTTINAFVEICITVFVFYSRMFPLKERKYAKGLKYALALLALLVRIAFFYFIPSFIPNVILSFALAYALLDLVFKGDTIDKLLTIVAYILYILIAELIILQFQNMFMVNPLYLNDISYQLIYITTTRTILFWLCLTNANIINRRFSRIPLYYWAIIITVPLASVIMLNTVYWSIIYSMDKYALYLGISIICLLYMNFSIFAFIDSYTTNVKVTVLESLIEKENENYKQLGFSYDEMRKMRHDFKNHVVMIKSLIKNNEISLLKKYIEDFESEIEEASMIYTKNPAIDAIINIKGLLAKENDIRYVVKTSNIIDTIYISPYNVCRILGNAIDNAIEACMRIKDETMEKFIFISFQKIENNIVILIENSADRVKKTFADQFESLKDNKSMHGLGLSIIRDAVDELGGFMNVQFQNNVFTLHVVIPYKGNATKTG